MLAEPTPCFMCSETLWWRCHRRLIAELLHARGEHVVHLLGPGKQQEHKPLLEAEVRAWPAVPLRRPWSRHQSHSTPRSLFRTRSLKNAHPSHCLDWLLIVNRRHLKHVLRVFVDHYKSHRPHRSLNRQPPDPTDHKRRIMRPTTPAVECRDASAASSMNTTSPRANQLATPLCAVPKTRCAPQAKRHRYWRPSG